MTNPMDRSLNEMRIDKEVNDNMVVEEAEVEELEQLGERLRQAFELSGEPPSLAAIEFAESTVTLPNRSPADIRRFTLEVRQRIASDLRAKTGAANIGSWFQKARSSLGLDVSAAARDAGVGVAAYRSFEDGRVPVWRLPAKGFALLCKDLAIDIGTLLRWASVSVSGERQGVYGRLDTPESERAEALDRLAEESAEQTKHEFDAWRREFIDAYDGRSGDDAPAER